MALNLANLNARGLRDPSKCAHILGELSNRVDVAVVQETHFTCVADYQVLENDYVVLSAYSSHNSIEVSLLIRRSLNVDVNLVLAGDRGQLVVVDVVKTNFMACHNLVKRFHLDHPGREMWTWLDSLSVLDSIWTEC